MSDFVSRGFTGRGHRGDDRLPPGQYEERGFPVLTAGPTPDVDTAEPRMIRTERFGPTG